jgi:hypothetical protein
MPSLIFSSPMKFLQLMIEARWLGLPALATHLTYRSGGWTPCDAWPTSAYNVGTGRFAGGLISSRAPVVA